MVNCELYPIYRECRRNHCNVHSLCSPEISSTQLFTYGIAAAAVIALFNLPSYIPYFKRKKSNQNNF
jgi:hypothetical protein